jgi:colanic acid biosynthesis glycosyl transferase WcaI
MHILILHMRYAPDATGTGPLVTQLAQDLARSSERVTVITSAPHYGKTNVEAQYRGGLIFAAHEQGVEVWRTAAFPRWSDRVLGRAVDYVLFTLLALWACLRVPKPDVILAVAPPITVGLVAWLAARLRRIPFAFNAQDIWPDGLIQMGRLRNPLLIQLFSWLERWTYAVANSVVVVSEGMRQNLLKKGVSPEKAVVIPNWVDLDEIKPVPRENPFRREQGLQDQFVVLFAGNLGFAAGLEHIVKAAHFCRQQPISFVLVGEGSAKAAIQAEAQELALSNVLFLPTQPVERLSDMLGMADLSLVTLRQGMGGLSVPSKTYAYMASARPILAAVPQDSAIRLLIEAAQCGRCIPSGQPEALCQAVLAMKALGSELEVLGERGRSYAESHCSRQVSVAHYSHLLNRLKATEAE